MLITDKIKQQLEIIGAIDKTLETLEYNLTDNAYQTILSMMLEVKDKHMANMEMYKKELFINKELALTIIFNYCDYQKNSYEDIFDKIHNGDFYVDTDIKTYHDFGIWYYKEYSDYKQHKDNDARMIQGLFEYADFTNYGKQIYDNHLEYFLDEKLGLLHIIW